MKPRSSLPHSQEPNLSQNSQVHRTGRNITQRKLTIGVVMDKIKFTTKNARFKADIEENGRVIEASHI
jgi:hypothetical protein